MLEKKIDKDGYYLCGPRPWTIVTGGEGALRYIRERKAERIRDNLIARDIFVLQGGAWIRLDQYQHGS